MSTLNQSSEESVECPLCLEPLEVDDLNFYPCTCGYQICRFCWNRIREGENGLCPACRKAYPENPADFTPLSREQVAAIKTEKRSREQRRRNKTLESRRQLANVRVVQKNLVFVVGLPVRLADPEVLKKQEYFGKYGKIHKVVINQSTAYAGAQLNGPSASAYVTYTSSADALRAIQSVNNVTIDGRVLKGSLGTTKYCANFMKNQPCPKADCMYLHDLGDPKASFTKEEMHQGLHQVYERKLHNQLIASMAYGGSNSTNGSSNNNSNSSSNTPIPASSSITICNNKSKKDSGQSNSSVSSQCSSGSGGSLSGANLAPNNGQMMNGSREAWPSLSSSPDHKHNTSPTNLQNHSPEPEYRNSQSDTGDSPLDKDMPSDNLRENYMSEDNTSRNNAVDRQSVFESRRPFSTRSVHCDSINDNDSLIDSDEHGLLEDDTHSLLESSHSHPSLLSHQSQRQLGPAFPTDASRLSHVLAQRPKFNSALLDYELLLRQQRHQTDLLSQQQQLSKTQPSDPHSLNSHYSATDVMQKFFSEFSLGQQMKQQNVTSPPHHQPQLQNSLPQLPTDVPTHAFIESQHLQRRYGQNVRSNGHMPQMNHNPQQMPQISQIEQLQINQMNQLNQLRQMMNLQMGNSAGQIPNLSALSSLTAQMSNLTAQISGMSAPQRRPGPDSRPPEDDLDFDPFKESQKAFADLIDNEVSQHRNNANMGLPHHGIQQNGVTNFNSSMVRGPPSAMAPPPGFHSHMNAFGLGVPRPQQNNMTSPPQSAQGAPNHGTDWTQMDPAIVSTSVTQPQQQDVFSRFANLSMAKQSALHNGQSLPGAPQQLQGRGDLALNMNGVNGHYGAPQQQKIWQGFAPNGANVSHRGFYGVEGPSKTVMTSVPPGFNLPINAAPIQNSNVSKNTECIESK